MEKLSIPEVLIVIVFLVPMLGFRLFRWGNRGDKSARNEKQTA